MKRLSILLMMVGVSLGQDEGVASSYTEDGCPPEQVSFELVTGLGFIF